MNKENSLVKQSHYLNMAKYNLSPLTIDILHVYLAQIKTEDTAFSLLRFNIGALEKKLNKQIDRRSLDSVTTELITTIIRVKLTEDKELKTSWCSSAIYDKQNHTLELEISKYLKDYLLNLRNKFVLSDFKILSKLKGSYAKRIYLMISQFNSTGFFKISLENLKEQLDIGDKYSIYSDFKKRVLVSSINQINEVLGIDLKIEETKIGRKIKLLSFTFDKKIQKERMRKSSNKQDLVQSWLEDQNQDIIDCEVD